MELKTFPLLRIIEHFFDGEFAFGELGSTIFSTPSVFQSDFVFFQHSLNHSRYRDSVQKVNNPENHRKIEKLHI